MTVRLKDRLGKLIYPLGSFDEIKSRFLRENGGFVVKTYINVDTFDEISHSPQG
jgi:hypothetical protein